MCEVCAWFSDGQLQQNQEGFTELSECSTQEAEWLPQFITGNNAGSKPMILRKNPPNYTPTYHPKIKNHRSQDLSTKTRLTTFFNHLDVVHHKLGPPGHTVNFAFCSNVLKHLTDST